MGSIAKRLTPALLERMATNKVLLRGRIEGTTSSDNYAMDTVTIEVVTLHVVNDTLQGGVMVTYTDTRNVEGGKYPSPEAHAHIDIETLSRDETRRRQQLAVLIKDWEHFDFHSDYQRELQVVVAAQRERGRPIYHRVSDSSLLFMLHYARLQASLAHHADVRLLPLSTRPVLDRITAFIDERVRLWHQVAGDPIRLGG